MNGSQLVNVQLIDRPNPPVRISFDEAELTALVDSIREKGILVPLLLRRTGDRFEVIDGDCRLEAACRLRLREVSAVVRDATDSETHVLRLLANLDRSDPDPLSEAIYIAKAIASGVVTTEGLAAQLHRSTAWIDDRLAIAEMPDYMQLALREKRLALGVALALSQIDDENVRRMWTNSAMQSGMTVRGAQDALREYRNLKELRAGASADAPPPPMPEAPPLILYPCAACGVTAPLEELRVVRVHLRGCPPAP